MKEVVKSNDAHVAQVSRLSVAANDIEPAGKVSAKVNRSSDNLKKRIADLNWQINFAQIQLNRWHALENGNWTSLKALQKTAKSELNALMLQ